MRKCLHIYYDDEDDAITDVMAQVERLINDGYTSGYAPDWDIEEVDE